MGDKKQKSERNCLTMNNNYSGFAALLMALIELPFQLLSIMVNLTGLVVGAGLFAGGFVLLLLSLLVMCGPLLLLLS
mgnify:CR=1 FL=1